MQPEKIERNICEFIRYPLIRNSSIKLKSPKIFEPEKL